MIFTWSGATSRFTPTCVGTAEAAPIRLASPAVHPHVRGDGAGEPLEAVYAGGSPPRAWGRLAQIDNDLAPNTVHPHVRGDGAADVTVQPFFDEGSVHPHVRGDGA